MTRSRLQCSTTQPGKMWRRLGWMICAIVATLLLSTSAGHTWESHYAITGRAPFNQPEYYPIQQTLSETLYRPVGAWVGRLILPEPQPGETDWVWMQVYHAPSEAADLIGQKIRLEWSQDAAVQQYVAAVTQSVKFTPDVKANLRTTGNLYPERLNGRSRVGPLQAIAGARPKDDVIVSLPQATRTQATSPGVLQIDAEPRLETGRYYTLVKILGTVKSNSPKFVPTACPGQSPCPSELFQVQHYNAATGQFDGVKEIVRIPQQPVDGFGVYASTPRELEKSPAGSAGWYLYGAQDKTGLFTVQAIKPRSLFQLQPQQVLLDQAQGLDLISYENWKDTEQKKGTIETRLVDTTAQTPEDAIAGWQAGDRALVMHLFGGRGGRSGEGAAMGTVTGHFSYGIAEVVRDPFTQELQFDVNYQQVYATNIEGFIAGTNTWTNYMGNLQRGWMGTRPVSDVLVKLDAIAQDYDFGGTRLSPLTELNRQLSIITARYRTGDGTGAANVTPATSCVQDSNQALFLTIQQIRETVEASPVIQQWWSSHPADPTVKRFERLIALGEDLQTQLIPLGIVRPDWQTNAAILSGTSTQQREFSRTSPDGTQNVVSALASWRTILPRQAQDDLSVLFLKHGAKLWFLRTNQVGGNNPDITPIAPTQAFGLWTLPGTEIPIVSIIFTRVLGAVKLPNQWEWNVTLWALLGYSLVALPLGFALRFLQFQPWKAPGWQYLLAAIRWCFLPALVEEFIFRVLLLPSPRAAVTEQMWFTWAIAGLILFVAFYPFKAITFQKSGNPSFFNPVFLILLGWLGVACTITYLLTGSLLAITLLHGVVFLVWIALLGGAAKLNQKPQKPQLSAM